MEGDSNQLHPMVDVEEDVEEEYENEDSIGISNVGTDSSPENEVAQDIILNEIPNQEDLEKIAYQRKQRKKTSHVWEHYIEVKIKVEDEPAKKMAKTSPFTGSARRLDGKPLTQSASPASSLIA